MPRESGTSEEVRDGLAVECGEEDVTGGYVTEQGERREKTDQITISCLEVADEAQVVQRGDADRAKFRAAVSWWAIVMLRVRMMG